MNFNLVKELNSIKKNIKKLNNHNNYNFIMNISTFVMYLCLCVLFMPICHMLFIIYLEQINYLCNSI